jgi:predicted phage terminase large subunit-like protein
MPDQNPSKKITRADLERRAEKVQLALDRKTYLASFYEYFQAAWHALNPDVPLTPSWHFEYLCEVLQWAYESMKTEHPEFRGVIINVPPRTLKSSLCNIIFPTWVWAKHPHKKFLCVSYAQEFTENEISVPRRKLLQSEWYQTLFPQTRIATDQNLKSRYDSTAGGYMVSIGCGGSGFGANVVVIDDILKLEDEDSAARDNANKFYEDTLFSRRNDASKDFYVVVSQRLHESDLPGYLLKNEAGLWYHVIVPLECEQDTDYIFPISGRVYQRKKGEILLPERFPPHEVKIRKSITRTWSGQCQQTPMPATGNLINPNWWQYYETDADGVPLKDKPLPAFDAVYVSADCSFKGTQKSDFVCLQKWGFVGPRSYLLELLNERMDYVRLKVALRNMITHGLQPDVTLIEAAANGEAVTNELKRENLPTTIALVTPDGGKLSRAHAAAPEVEVGNCYLPSNAPWLAEFTKQLALGPEIAANDDQIDSWSQAMNYRRSHRWGFFEVLEKEKQKQTSQQKVEPVQQVIKQHPAPTHADLVSAANNATRSEFRSRLGRRRF